MRIRILDKITFECGHLRLVEQRRIRPTPHVCVVVYGIFARTFRDVGVESLAHQHSDVVHQFLACEFPVAYKHLFQRTVFVQRHRSVIHQVGVADVIETSVRKQYVDMSP